MDRKKAMLISVCVLGAITLTACGSPEGNAQKQENSKEQVVSQEPREESKTKPDTEEKEAAKETPQAEEDTAGVEGKNAFFGEFSTTDLEGQEVTEDIFSDKKLTMVNLWTTYCGYCLDEMPELAELNEEHAFEGFQVLGFVLDVINYDGSLNQEQIDTAKAIVEKTGADYTHALPNKELLNRNLGSVPSVPMTIFLDENGNQVGDVYPGARDKAGWDEVIQSLLKEV